MSLKSVKTLTAAQIAKKWNLPLRTVMNLIDAGAKVEKEHDKNVADAKQIARDHLSERPDYYKKLHKLEKSKISMKEGISAGPEREVPIIGDLTGNSRRVAKVEEKNDLKGSCWKGYTAKGLKKKGNRMVPNCVPVEEEQIEELSAELVGKVSNARWRRGEAPSKTLSRAINKKFIKSDKMKELKKEDIADKDWNDTTGKKLPEENIKGAKGTTKTIHEETKMDTKDHINEALDNILENNLSEMKENLLAALQEKAMEKLEEKKKDIAASYFAQ